MGGRCDDRMAKRRLMPSEHIRLSADARVRVKKGIDILANAVRITGARIPKATSDTQGNATRVATNRT